MIADSKGQQIPQTRLGLVAGKVNCIAVGSHFVVPLLGEKTSHREGRRGTRPLTTIITPPPSPSSIYKTNLSTSRCHQLSAACYHLARNTPCASLLTSMSIAVAISSLPEDRKSSSHPAALCSAPLHYKSTCVLFCSSTSKWCHNHPDHRRESHTRSS